MLERVNDNASKLDLPGEYNVSATFNVTDLSPFDVGDDLRTNPFQEGGNDVDIKATPSTPTNGPMHIPIGPLTRARARRFKEELNIFTRRLLQQGEEFTIVEGERRVVTCIKVEPELKPQGQGKGLGSAPPF